MSDYNLESSEAEVEVVDHVDVSDPIPTESPDPQSYREMVDYDVDLLVEKNHVSMFEAEVEVVDHVPYTFGTHDELHTVNVDVIEPIDQIPTETSDPQSYRHSIDIDHRHGCDKNDMFVPTSDQGQKRMCCVYCRKRYSKLVRHLETVHKDELDVRAFRDLPIGSKERRYIIDGIRKRGQFDWNMNAEINGGEFIPSRRPNAMFYKKAADYGSCAKCFGQILDKGLREHWNKCTGHSMKRERIVKALGRAVEKRLHVDACDELTDEIFPHMQESDCVQVIRYDWLLTVFGNDLCLNYSPHYQKNVIKRYLRAAGTLLLAAKPISKEITDFASLFHVMNCNTVIAAIYNVTGFDRKTKTFKKPSTAATSITLINNIAEVFLVESMKADNEKQEKIVTRFSTVFQKEAKVKINKIVGVMKEKSHRERDENIPSTDDVGRLAEYIDLERDKCFADLTQNYSYEKWVYLAQLTMASIIVFNRRRVGEVQNIFVRDFNLREMIAERCDNELLPDASLENTKLLIKSRMKIRGKLNRTVPVLLKHTTDKCLELLLSHRKEAGVPDSNNFLFALQSESGKTRIINGCAIMLKLSDLCGAKNPTSLRGTKLRKQLASVCSTMGLDDNDVTNIANFMGHDDKVHRDIYRHNPLQREVVQMTGLLEAAQGRKAITSGTTNSKVVKVATRKGQKRKMSEESNLISSSAKNRRNLKK